MFILKIQYFASTALRFQQSASFKDTLTTQVVNY